MLIVLSSLLKGGEYFQWEFSTQAVVANIKADGILGLDFIQTNECLVDVCKTRIYVHGVEKNWICKEILVAFE